MKTTSILAAAAGALAQNLSGMPACATSCIGAAVSSAGCQVTDMACQCGTAAALIASIAAPCVLGYCPVDQIVNIAAAGSAACAAFSATTTTAGTATTSASSSTVSATLSNTSTTASPTASPTASSTASSTGTGPIIGGVVGGIVVLIALLIAFFWKVLPALKEWRRKRMEERRYHQNRINEDDGPRGGETWPPPVQQARVPPGAPATPPESVGDNTSTVLRPHYGQEGWEQRPGAGSQHRSRGSGVNHVTGAGDGCNMSDLDISLLSQSNMLDRNDRNISHTSDVLGGDEKHGYQYIREKGSLG